MGLPFKSQKFRLVIHRTSLNKKVHWKNRKPPRTVNRLATQFRSSSQQILQKTMNKINSSLKRSLNKTIEEWQESARRKKPLICQVLHAKLQLLGPINHPKMTELEFKLGQLRANTMCPLEEPQQLRHQSQSFPLGTRQLLASRPESRLSQDRSFSVARSQTVLYQSQRSHPKLQVRC